MLHRINMDLFATPERSKASDISQWQIFSKEDVITFLKSIDFPAISVPRRYTTSSDEDSLGPFLQFFFAELSKAIFKSSPPKTSPKKLLKMAYVFGDEMRRRSYAFGDETISKYGDEVPARYIARPTKHTINLQQTSAAFRHAVTDTDSAAQSIPSTPSETTMSPLLPITPAELEDPTDFAHDPAHRTFFLFADGFQGGERLLVYPDRESL